MSYLTIKSLHIVAATASIAGFVLRGYWMMLNSDKLQLRFVRVAPHIIDTVFLLSGIALVSILQLNVLREVWILAKISALIAYVLLGTLALRRGPTLKIRMTAFIGALAVFAYIVGVATTKSAASWFLPLTV